VREPRLGSHARAADLVAMLRKVALLVALAGAGVAHADEAKKSLKLESDSSAWQDDGFRLTLGVDYGRFYGLEGAPSGHLVGPLLRVGLRLDADWSIFASFKYVRAKQSGGLSGLRFAGTIDPTWNVTPHLSLAMGFGFGGIVEGSGARMDPPQPPPDTQYTYPSPHTPLSSCSGVGAAALARATYQWVIGTKASTGFSLEAIGQWTGCVADTGTVEPDTGLAIVRRQWWPHVGGTLSWEITWR